MMFQILICLSFLAVKAYGNGELTILHHPNSLVFKGHDHVKESILTEVYSTALGFSTQQYSNWEGFLIEDPFNLAEAVVTVAVDGVPDIDYSKGHRFPLKTDESESKVFTSLQKRVTDRYPEGNSHLIRIDFANGLEELQGHQIFQGIKTDKPKKSIYTHLKNNVDEDREFLKEITLLDAAIEKIEQNVQADNVPDVFWFRIGSLHAIADLYGENSTHVKEAKHVLNDAITRLNSAFSKAYGDRVLVSVVASDAVHTRRGRSILQAKADDAFDKLHLAKEYSKDYPVIFNIILWFGVAMVFSLLAICLAIGTMDPGRDSIIYRMTSTRMKKDN